MRLIVLIETIKRKRIFRIASLYVVSAWLAIEVCATLFPIFDLPDALQRAIVILAALGLPVAVAWAWTIPDSDSTDAQFEAEATETFARRRTWRAYLPLFVTIVLAVSGLTLWLLRQSGEREAVVNVADVMRTGMIGVAPFDNLSGSIDLEQIGMMTADWITQLLAETGKVKIISPVALRERLKFLSTIDGKGVPPAADVMINGRYYLQEGNLIIHTQIINGHTQEIIRVLEPRIGDRRDPVRLIDDLAQEIAGYLLLREREIFAARPPKYHAYREFARGIEIWGDEDYDRVAEYMKNAYRLDTTFYHAVLALGVIYHNTWRWNTLDTLLRELESVKPQLLEADRLRMKWLRANLDGDRRTQAETAFRLNLLFPQERAFNYNAALAARDALNNPRLALEILESFDDRFLQYEDCLICQWRHGLIMEAFFQLGEYQRAITFAAELSYENQVANFAWSHIAALVMLDSLEGAKHWIKQYSQKTLYGRGILYAPPHLHLAALLTSLNAGKEEAALGFARDLLSMAKIRPDDLCHEGYLAIAYYTLGHYELGARHGRAFFEKIPANIPNMLAFNLGMEGLCYIAMGDSARLEALMDEIRQTPASIPFGSREYTLGMLEAARGDKATAVAYLRTALEKGDVFQSFKFNYFFPFRALMDYPPFQELIRPRPSTVHGKMGMAYTSK
jgi:hypothetical protein